jgi:hypothetical protein
MQRGKQAEQQTKAALYAHKQHLTHKSSTLLLVLLFFSAKSFVPGHTPGTH